MKTLLFCCFIFSAVSQLAFSQHYKFELAAEGGPGFSRVWGEGSKQIENQVALPSFQTGIGMRFATPKVIGFTTGVYVERKGFRIPIEVPVSDAESVTYQYNTHYNYATIPLMLGATMGNKVQFFVQAGGFVSALFRIHIFCEELDFDGINPSGYQYVDAGFSGGMGIKVPVKERLIFSVEARNTTGFRQIIKNTESADVIKNTNTTFLFGVGYAFRKWESK